MRKLYRWFRRGAIIMLPVVLFYCCTLYYVYDHMDGNAVLPAECGIVFGTAVWPVYNADGKVINAVAGPGIRRRVSAAAGLYREGNLKKLFLTGGKGEGNRTSEGQVMGEYAQSLGIPRGDMTVEDRSRSTWENLLYTRSLTSGCKSIVAISDGYHLARIGLQAHLQGIPLTTYSAVEIESKLFTFRNLLREAMGIDLLVLSSLSR